MTADSIRLIVLLSLLFLSSYTDIRYRKIKNIVTFPAIAVGIILCILYSPKDLPSLIIGLFIWFIFVFFPLMGMGDLKLLMAISSLIGFYNSIISLLCAAAIMSLYILLTDSSSLIRAIKNVKNRFFYHTPLPEDGIRKYPFAPFISLGTICVIFIRLKG